MAMFAFSGATAVVTGAASGIGEAVARGLAARGSHLVLLDRDEGRLQHVAESIRTGHSTVDAHVVDLADPAATDRVARTVLSDHPRIRLLVNNAGVALRGRFDQVTLDEFSWVLAVNFGAMVHLTHVLLPALTAEPGSHLVNVSSVFGLVAPAGQTAYAASKFAVRGFTDALREELASDGVSVSCVHPGGVRTRIAESARTGGNVPAESPEERERWQRVLTMDPAKAAAVILRGVQTRRRRIVIGRTAKVLDLLARTAPTAYGPILTAVARRRLGGAA